MEFATLDDLVSASGLHASAAHRAAFQGHEVDHDELLARLVRTAAHDELAARVVLQRLLPGLISRARRWRRRPGESSDSLDEVITAAWSAIRTFPIDRRSADVAARLLRNCEHQAFVKHTRRRWTQVPAEPATLDLPVLHLPDSDPIVELAELVFEARTSVLTDDDLQLIRLLVSGRPISEVASALEVSVRTVTNHRAAMVHRLRQVALAA